MEEMNLIGMEQVKQELSELVRLENVYRKGKARLPNFLIMLDPGDGQTYTTEAITDVLAEHRLREFHGLDEYLEYRTDGTLLNLKWIFSNIEDNAIYDNEYKGVISMDVSKMANVQNEYQMKYLEEQLARVSRAATVILYCAADLGKKGESLVRRLCAAVENVKVIEHVGYSSRELAEMTVRNIQKRGIEVCDKDRTVKVLSGIVEHREVKTAKEAIALAEELVFYADYSKPVPVLELGKTRDFVRSSRYGHSCKEVM